MLDKLLDADHLLLTHETIERLKNKFRKRKEDLESTGLKYNLRKSKVMVSRGITMDGMSKVK